MPFVLTEGSTVSCGHPPGVVAKTGTAKLTVNNHPALLKKGIQGRTVSGCEIKAVSDPSGPLALPCAAVIAVNSGEATKLTVGGESVILETLTGSTNGLKEPKLPQSLLNGKAAQNKLTAR
jgi:hypothetical protein